jgi:dTDP-glucose 4,6-dehydratase
VSILVTGGAGFIGSAFVHAWCSRSSEPIVTLDLLTYAGNLDNFADLPIDSAHRFIRGDIRDAATVRRVLDETRPRAVFHLAAETHVDRSIRGAEAFVSTNVGGTACLLQACTDHLADRSSSDWSGFRFIHVSTDEVFGSLGPDEPAFSRQSHYRPNSPYAASKAAADHLVRAWHVTHQLPTITTHCSNNYGPRQFPEKLIPLCIARATAGETLPVYGDGLQVRDWLHVDDHCSGLRAVLDRGVPGSTYLFGGRGECPNLELVRALCETLDRAHPDAAPHADLIRFVEDRPGHDRRYAIDATDSLRELAWEPQYTLIQGLHETVQWYLAHEAWLDRIRSGAYASWIQQQYGP